MTGNCFPDHIDLITTECFYKRPASQDAIIKRAALFLAGSLTASVQSSAHQLRTTPLPLAGRNEFTVFFTGDRKAPAKTEQHLIHLLAGQLFMTQHNRMAAPGIILKRRQVRTIPARKGLRWIYRISSSK